MTMSKLIQRISFLTILVLGVVSVVLVALIYFGGNNDPLMVGEEALTNPRFTEPLLFWTYALIGLTILCTITVTLTGFIKDLVSNPKSALKTIIPLVVFALVFVAGWLLGSDDKISIIGYEGEENLGFWAHFTDMVVYSIYALFIAIGLTIVGAAAYTKLK
jgi:hypothetical protein